MNTQYFPSKKIVVQEFYFCENFDISENNIISVQAVPTSKGIIKMGQTFYSDRFLFLFFNSSSRSPAEDRGH